MRALVFDGALRVLDRPEPRPGPGEALIAVRRAGICNTDVEIARGYMGFHGVLGHEFVGEVLEVHDAAHRAWVGRRVAGEINLGCGGCARCLAGLARHCKTRTVLGILGRDGALAERLTLPVANLHAVPDDLDDDGAVFIEPVAACFEVLEQLKVEPDARVIVLGDGKLGIMLAQVLRGAGCALTLVGKHPRKLTLARAAGITTARVDDDVPGDADVVVEATGPRARAVTRAPARHGGAQEHLSRRARRQHRAHRDRRGLRARLALRPLRARGPRARGEAGGSAPAHRRDLPPRRRRGGLRARAAPRRAEGAHRPQRVNPAVATGERGPARLGQTGAPFVSPLIPQDRVRAFRTRDAGADGRGHGGCFGGRP
ncbi:MAG: alcohol dehydrogenase catalytic domain-containing protein [Polyangiales bacterium]